MATIYGANTLSSGFDVANSIRLDGRDSDTRLEYTASGASNRRTWTWSAWIKRGTTDSSSNFQVLFSSTPTGPAERIMLENDYLTYDHDKAGTDFSVRSTRKLRDFSAWYHVVVMKDTTQSTETNRVKMYINGVQETLVEVQEGYPGQNLESTINTAAETQLFAQADGEEFGGYACEVAFCDGQNLAASDFGEFDSDSPTIWKPIDISDLTFGTNGYYLKFEDSSALGTDSSGNGNNYTTANLAATDQSTDTCTNNFATFNPLNVASGGTFTLDRTNLRIKGADSIEGYTASTIGFTQGKWYFECESNFNTQGVVGITFDGVSGQVADDIRSDRYPGNATYSYGYIFSSGNKITNSSRSSYGNSLGTGDILGVAIDLDNKKLYFSKNGTFQNSGDPTSGSTGTGAIALTGTGSDGFCFVTVGDNNNAGYGQIDFNFGNPFTEIF